MLPDFTLSGDVVVYLIGHQLSDSSHIEYGQFGAGSVLSLFVKLTPISIKRAPACSRPIGRGYCAFR